MGSHTSMLAQDTSHYALLPFETLSIWMDAFWKKLSTSSISLNIGRSRCTILSFPLEHIAPGPINLLFNWNFKRPRELLLLKLNLPAAFSSEQVDHIVRPLFRGKNRLNRRKSMSSPLALAFTLVSFFWLWSRQLKVTFSAFFVQSKSVTMFLF